ncbi:hypothetical protein [Amycolatopsis sp. NPDC003861]
MGDRFDLRGAHFKGSAVGSHASVNHYTSGPAVPVEDLLEALARVRPDIIAAAPAADRAEVQAEVDKIEEELKKEEPRGKVVRNRWETVTTLIGDLSAPLTKITELVLKLFG